MKKLLALVLAVTMLLQILPAMAEAPEELFAVPEELSVEALEAEMVQDLEMLEALSMVDIIEVPEEVPADIDLDTEFVSEEEIAFEAIPEMIEEVVVPAEPDPEDAIVYDVPGEIEAAFGSTYNGNIAGAGYIYYYKLTLPTAGYVSVIVNSMISSLDTALYDSSLTVKYEESNGFGNGSGLHIMRNWLTAGTYYVRVGYAGVIGSFTFSSTFTSANATINGAVTEREAAVLNANGTMMTGVFCVNDPGDYLVLNVTTPGRFEIKLSSAQDGQPLQAQMYNAVTYTTVGSTYVIGSSTELVAWLMPGNYILYIDNAGSSGYGRYTAIPTFTAVACTDAEPNDGRGTAMPVNPSSASVAGMITLEDEADCFSFTLTTPAWVNISVNACMDALNVELYNSEMTTLIANDNRTGTGGNALSPYPHFIRYRLDPGSYYIKLSRSGSVCGNYTMSVATSLTYTSLTPSANPVELGTSVLFTANYVGTETILQRIWTVRDDTNTVLFTTNTNNSDLFTYTPGKVGKFTVTLQAYDGQNWDYITSDVITCQQTPALHVTGVSVSGAMKAGEPLTLTVNTIGGNGISKVNWNFYYAADYIHPNYLYSTSTGSNTATMIFNGAGAYAAYVEVCDAKTGAWAGGWGDWFSVSPADYFQILSVSLSDPSVTVGKPMTCNVSFSGKHTFVQCDVYDQNNVRVASYSGNNTNFTFVPSKTGNYHMWITAWDGVSWVNASSAWFTVTDPSSPVNIVSFVPNATSIELGKTVTFNLTTTGSQPISTTYTVYDQYNNVVYTWTGNSDYMEFGPNKIGSYYCVVSVFDGVTTQTSTSAMVGVSMGSGSAFTATLTGIAASYAAGDPVQFTLNITGTRPMVTANYYICDTDPSTAVWSWSGNATDVTGWSWTPGHYRVYAEVYNGIEWTNTSSDWFDII